MTFFWFLSQLSNGHMTEFWALKNKCQFSMALLGSLLKRESHIPSFASFCWLRHEIPPSLKKNKRIDKAGLGPPPPWGPLSPATCSHLRRVLYFLPTLWYTLNEILHVFLSCLSEPAVKITAKAVASLFNLQSPSFLRPPLPAINSSTSQKFLLRNSDSSPEPGLWREQ